MALTLSITIKNCSECRHVGHSGNFTPGGAKPICDHPKASEMVKIIKDLRDDNANDIPDSELNKQCWYWKNRVIPYKRVESDLKGFAGSPRYTREPKKIPNWCPLQNGEKY